MCSCKWQTLYSSTISFTCSWYCLLPLLRIEYHLPSWSSRPCDSIENDSWHYAVTYNLYDAKEVGIIGASAICWALWKARNNVCFENIVIKSPLKIVCHACALIIKWEGLSKELQDLLHDGAKLLLKAWLMLDRFTYAAWRWWKLRSICGKWSLIDRLHVVVDHQCWHRSLFVFWPLVGFSKHVLFCIWFCLESFVRALSCCQ